MKGVRIDAHQHFWQVARGDYRWLTPERGVLYRDFGPADLAPLLARVGIDRTIVVQAAPTVAETEYLLALAEQHAMIAGVVGWLDMEADDFSRQLARLRRHPKFVGVRPMIQDVPDDAWMIRPQVKKSFAVLSAEGVPFDFLTFPRHLPYVLQVLYEFPRLRAVVDHLSKPPIAEGLLDPWREQIARVAEHPNVMCKLSGMVTEADHRRWRPADLAPYVHHVMQHFGPRRVMFGSDWPVCLLAADYPQVYGALREALGEWLTAHTEPLIFGANAADFYGIER